MTALGYVFGLTGARSWAVTILLAIAFTAVILLIADLHQPRLWVVQVSQQPLTDLINKISAPVP